MIMGYTEALFSLRRHMPLSASQLPSLLLLLVLWLLTSPSFCTSSISSSTSLREAKKTEPLLLPTLAALAALPRLGPVFSLDSFGLYRKLKQRLADPGLKLEGLGLTILGLEHLSSKADSEMRSSGTIFKQCRITSRNSSSSTLAVVARIIASRL
jgi:hypothetical protein